MDTNQLQHAAVRLRQDAERLRDRLRGDPAHGGREVAEATTHIEAAELWLGRALQVQKGEKP